MTLFEIDIYDAKNIIYFVSRVMDNISPTFSDMSFIDLHNLCHRATLPTNDQPQTSPASIKNVK